MQNKVGDFRQKRRLLQRTESARAHSCDVGGQPERTSGISRGARPARGEPGPLLLLRRGGIAALPSQGRPGPAAPVPRRSGASGAGRAHSGAMPAARLRLRPGRLLLLLLLLALLGGRGAAALGRDAVPSLRSEWPLGVPGGGSGGRAGPRRSQRSGTGAGRARSPGDLPRWSRFASSLLLFPLPIAVLRAPGENRDSFILASNKSRLLSFLSHKQFSLLFWREGNGR